MKSFFGIRNTEQKLMILLDKIFILIIREVISLSIEETNKLRAKAIHQEKQSFMNFRI
jgi:hypothetical protein